MDEDRRNDMPVNVSTQPPGDLPEARDGTYDGDVRLTEFAERRLDEAERLPGTPTSTASRTWTTSCATWGSPDGR